MYIQRSYKNMGRKLLRFIYDLEVRRTGSVVWDFKRQEGNSQGDEKS